MIKTNKKTWLWPDNVFGTHNFEAGKSIIMVVYNHATIRIINWYFQMDTKFDVIGRLLHAPPFSSMVN